MTKTIKWSMLLLLSLLPSMVTAQEEGAERPTESPAAREGHRFLARAGTNGRIPSNALVEAKEAIDRMRILQKLSNKQTFDAGIGGWEWLGPGNIGGRIRSIVIHPQFPDIMWVGSASGGIWRTNTGGSSWFPQNDFMASLSVNAMVIDPLNTSTLYAGTGEGITAGAQALNTIAAQGAGIFKTTNGGINWVQLTSTRNNGDFFYVNRLAHHPTVDNTVLAATGTGKLFRTTDGGTTWNLLTNTSGQATDVKYDPLNANLIVVGSSSDLYLSNDGGATWNRQTTGAANKLPLAPGRCEIAFASTGGGGRIYVSINRAQGEVWRSTDGGLTWQLRNTATKYLDSQGWYANTIWVSPVNDSFVVAGGLDLYRSVDGGTTLTKISDWNEYHTGKSAHADQHMIVSATNLGTDNWNVYFGNDGGIQRANDIRTVSQSSGWTNMLNGMGITQFYGGAALPDGSVIVGGTQDNDKLVHRPSYGMNWHQHETGDGGYAAIDPSYPSRIYGAYPYLMMKRSDDGGVTYQVKVNGLTDSCTFRNPACNKSLFLSPFVMDPNNPDILVAGGQNIWRTIDNADNWTQIRTAIASGAQCSAIEVAKGNSACIWVGYTDGTVSRTTDGGTNWTNVGTVIFPNAFVTDVAVNPSKFGEVVVTFGGYNGNNVYRTNDTGSTWGLRTGTAPFRLPSIQVNTVRFHPTEPTWIYVGTDLGVFSSEDDGISWNVAPLSQNDDGTTNDGPVNVEVDELFWQGNDFLIAATFGRGMFRSGRLGRIYVDGSNPGIQDGSFQNPYSTVSAGLANSGNGSIISIKAGTYHEPGLVINKRKKLVARDGNVIIQP